MSVVWHRLPAPLPGMRMWGSCHGRCQFVLTHDRMHGRFAVSVKRVANSARVDLGEFRRRSEAIAAAEQYLKGQA
jgi:hypothetical protein